MNRPVPFLLFSGMLLLFSVCTAVAQKLTLAWQTDTVFRVPESVLIDPDRKICYVSNIDGGPGEKDGKGFISKISPGGKILNLQWVTGLDAPKRMGIAGLHLYVADLFQVAVIDLASGKIVRRIDVPDAKFLNDITVDKAGTVYVSDSGTGKIHRIQGDAATLYFESPLFQRINGLLAQPEGIYVADVGNGALYCLKEGKDLVKVSDVATGGNDGIVPVGKQEFIVSCWPGEAYFVDAQGKSHALLDTREQKLNCADVEYDATRKWLYVPTFFGNRIMTYTFQK
ncbi:SMP-30/gluconolactonase/LRE family protein [Parachryseolinea silvisoli]|uniref:SMP-30/gluconolactonase/LRE family protein n=1 Tax=Parachryseolinea silvisoli TaxID=2873601 RepID=UPI002265EA3F|nr:ATP/GTP-binding protein [Parachryseolinea silvisoli]MCD9019392.1 ATP/GTP-binding protein [Parachryseolinea silvisoli]